MKVAESYKYYNYDESKAFEKSGKLYVKATCKCDRCVKGVYPCRIENNRPVPYPVANGVCFACGGSGIITKEIRLYTDEEFERMQKGRIRAKAKKAEDMEARRIRECEIEKRKWLERENFNTDGVTYVYIKPDSYDVKDDLKALGFSFNYTLLWHINKIPAGYEEKVAAVKREDVMTFSAWGTGTYNEDAAALIQKLIAPREAEIGSNSQFIEPDENNKILAARVTCTGSRQFAGMYGISTMYTFLTEDGNIIIWYTSSAAEIEKGEIGSLKATFKAHKEYRGTRQTVVTRLKWVPAQ